MTVEIVITLILDLIFANNVILHAKPVKDIFLINVQIVILNTI